MHAGLAGAGPLPPDAPALRSGGALLLEEQTRRHTVIPPAFPLKEVNTPQLAQWIRLLGSATDERMKT